jgi:hypothetical protein
MWICWHNLWYYSMLCHAASDITSTGTRSRRRHCAVGKVNTHWPLGAVQHDGRAAIAGRWVDSTLTCTAASRWRRRARYSICRVNAEACIATHWRRVCCRARSRVRIARFYVHTEVTREKVSMHFKAKYVTNNINQLQNNTSVLFLINRRKINLLTIKCDQRKTTSQVNFFVSSNATKIMQSFLKLKSFCEINVLHHFTAWINKEKRLWSRFPLITFAREQVDFPTIIS